VGSSGERSKEREREREKVVGFTVAERVTVG
jgi:hypothetical protein